MKKKICLSCCIILLFFFLCWLLFFFNNNKKTDAQEIIKAFVYQYMSGQVLNEPFFSDEIYGFNNQKTFAFVFANFYDLSNAPEYFSAHVKNFLSTDPNDRKLIEIKRKEIENKIKKKSYKEFVIYSTLSSDYFIFSEDNTLPQIDSHKNVIETVATFSKIDAYIYDFLAYTFNIRKMKFHFSSQEYNNVSRCIIALNNVVSMEYKRTSSELLSPCFLYSVALLVSSYNLPSDFLTFFRIKIIEMAKSYPSIDIQKKILIEINNWKCPERNSE